MRPTLYIGNKNYSSWSLRPWLALTWGEIPFDEVVLQLGGEAYGRAAIPAIRAVSPTGKVPALRLDADLVLVDSLAICEWAAEQTRTLWPADPRLRAVGRSAVAELHSGFGALRRDLTMNLRRRVSRTPDLPAETRAELDRLYSLWTELLARSGGPWLLGQRSIADAFYAPVVGRLRTYAIPVPDALRPYTELVLADDAFRAWDAAAAVEPWHIEDTDAAWPGL